MYLFLPLISLMIVLSYNTHTHTQDQTRAETQNTAWLLFKLTLGRKDYTCC